MPQQKATPELTLPVVEEQLDVGRRTVERPDALRLRKQVQTHTEPVQEPLTSESVAIERVRVDRVVDAPPELRHEGDVTVVPVVEERLVTRKELVLVEEIRITRRRETRTAQAEVPLRRERIVIERFDPDTQSWRVEDEPDTNPKAKE